MRILLNRIKTPDGTILTSYHRHDFVMHRDANGNNYGVDGGTEYLKRTYTVPDFEDLSVSIDEDVDLNGPEFELIRESIHWGSRGKDGDQPLSWIKLKEMTDEHLDALLNVYKGPVDPFYKKCFAREIEYRISNYDRWRKPCIDQ